MSEQHSTEPGGSTVDMSAQPKTKPCDSSLERLRIKKAFWLAILGLALAAILVIVLVAAGWKTSSDIVAIVGLFTSVLGTLVGAFFGVQVGAADKARANERADNVQKKASALAAAADANTIEKAKKLYPDLFV